MRKVFLDELPRKGKLINWKKSVGYKVRFIYDDIEGWIKIVSCFYENGRPCLYIKYLDKDPFEIKTDSFQKCQLGKLLGTHTNEFKIEIGTTYKDEKRDITIIDREYRIKYKKNNKHNDKYYKYICNECGYEGWTSENYVLNVGTGCINHKTIIEEGVNDIPTTAPWMIKYFQGGYEEAKQYTKCSTSKIYPICPDCGRVRSRETLIYNIYQHKSISCSCNDKIPYPEKFIFSVLEQLRIDFQTQLTKTTFQWCDEYRYDFYFEYNNESYIIETHGRQHYEGNDNWKISLNKVKENDRIKKQLALSNGIKEENYIVINCKESELEWIRDNVSISRLNELFGLSNINWLKCEEFALKNRVKVACELKRDNPNMTTTEIGKIMKINKNTVICYLKKGSKIWKWCKYDPKEEMLKSNSKNGKANSKPVEMFKDGISLGIFKSAVDLEKQSEKLFGVKLFNSNISAVCLDKHKQYKGFTFKFV